MSAAADKGRWKLSNLSPASANRARALSSSASVSEGNTSWAASNPESPACRQIWLISSWDLPTKEYPVVVHVHVFSIFRFRPFLLPNRLHGWRAEMSSNHKPGL